MNSHSILRKTSLTALLLTGCCYAVADPASLAAVPDTDEQQSGTPVTPAVQPPAAAETLASPDARATAVASGKDKGSPDAAALPDPRAAGPETAGRNSPGAEGAGNAGMEDVPEAPSAVVPAIDPAALYGEWIVREQHPDAGEVVTLFSINADGSFAGTMTVAGNVVWSYSGNWSLDGNLIAWFYTRSSPPLMLVDETEVDEIISVDSEKLVYRSGKRDVLETLYRASH
jgi:hypothetical protein